MWRVDTSIVYKHSSQTSSIWYNATVHTPANSPSLLTGIPTRLAISSSFSHTRRCALESLAPIHAVLVVVHIIHLFHRVPKVPRFLFRLLSSHVFVSFFAFFRGQKRVSPRSPQVVSPHGTRCDAYLVAGGISFNSKPESQPAARARTRHAVPGHHPVGAALLAVWLPAAAVPALLDPLIVCCAGDSAWSRAGRMEQGTAERSEESKRERKRERGGRGEKMGTSTKSRATVGRYASFSRSGM